MTIVPGFTSSKPYLFDAEGIIAFARSAGDHNWLHRDAEAARASRFGAMIASGAQMSAVLMGFGASLLSDAHEAAGLEFRFRFVKAVPAGTVTTLRWTITAVEPNARIGGRITDLEGAIIGADGTIHVSATGKAVVWDKRLPAE